MKEDYLFDTQKAAQDVLKELRKIAYDYGAATVADFKDLIGLSGSYMYNDHKMGWTPEKLRGARIILLNNYKKLRRTPRTSSTKRSVRIL